MEAQPHDSRNLDDQIAAALRKHGFIATSQRPEEFDYRVTYEDQWYWDMRMYLIDLRIDVRDADTNVLVASARSYQTSLAAMGKTHASVIDAAVEVLAVGVAESPPPRRDGSRRGRRRR